MEYNPYIFIVLFQHVQVLNALGDQPAGYAMKLERHTVNFHVLLTMEDALQVQCVKKHQLQILVIAVHLQLPVKVRV